MKNIIKRIAFTLAGLGLLTSAVQADFPEKLHDQIRNRVINEVGIEPHSKDLVRSALEKDPNFGLILEYFQERSLNGIQSFNDGEDAVQDATLKIWRLKPQIFLKPHDEVIRYFRTSAKRSYFTQLSKNASRKTTSGTEGLESMNLTQSLFQDPAEEAAARDLLEELSSRLQAEDMKVLDAYLSNSNLSQRKIAERLGVSRYAVAGSVGNIKHALSSLLKEDPILS